MKWPYPHPALRKRPGQEPGPSPGVRGAAPGSGLEEVCHITRSLASLPSASFEIVPKSVQWEMEQEAVLVFGSQLPWLLMAPGHPVGSPLRYFL